MESIAPPLALLLCVKRAIEKGQPTREGVLNYIRTGQQDQNGENHAEFSGQVALWLSLLKQGQSTQKIISVTISPQRRVLLQLLERGFAGEAIYQTLCQLEIEIVEACQDELARRLARLPFILLIPLLFFQFPAFLLLLFGPLLQNFFHSLGGG